MIDENERQELIKNIKALQVEVDQVAAERNQALESEQVLRSELNTYLFLQNSEIQELKFRFMLAVSSIRQELAGCRHDYRSALKRLRASLISSY
jgi:hypothetical protein